MAKSKKRPIKKQAVPEKKDRLTWRYWLIGIGIIALTVGVIALITAIDNGASWVTFTEKEGGIIRDYDDRMFLKAPETYAVRYTVGGKYGKMGDDRIYKVGFYNSYGVLKEMDPENYLTDGKGTFYYGSYATLPELTAFRDRIYVCSEYANVVDGETNIQTVSWMSLSNENTPDVDDFIAAYRAGTRYDLDNGGTPQTTYTLYLTSSTYDYLYYVMYLVYCDNGDFYAYTKEDRSSITVPKELFSQLIATEKPAETTKK